MGFLLVTALVAAIAIFIVASLLGWVFRKVASDRADSLNPTVTTLVLVAVTTAIYVFVMTRPAVIGPYEQFTLSNIGGQVLGGAVAAGFKLWLDAE